MPGGRLYLTVPLVWELHEEPYDFYRDTRYGLAHLLGEAGFVDAVIEPRNDCSTTIAQLMRNVSAVIGQRDDGLDPSGRSPRTPCAGSPMWSHPTPRSTPAGSCRSAGA